MLFNIFVTCCFFSLLFLYLRHVHRVLTSVPPKAKEFAPRRWTTQETESTAARIYETPVNIAASLPACTGRRYIIIGGSGFLGGWIVRHLLLRGEHPSNLRIIDIRPPVRKDLLIGQAAEVPHIFADVCDIDSLRFAFAEKWPANRNYEGKQGSAIPITVIHTAAVIRHYERNLALLHRSSPVNVDGTRHALQVSREFPVDIFLYTSSASVSIRPMNCWVWPWQKYPKDFVQVLDDKSPAASQRSDFPSNYQYTKYIAEQMVREADRPSEGFRTGCLRPGNPIYGSGGDMCAGAYLARGNNPSWIAHVIHSCVYVENVSYALLLYETRLSDSKRGPGTISDVGGQVFCITDRGDAISYGDMYRALTMLTGNTVQFPPVPPVPMLILAYVIEAWQLASAGALKGVIPPIKGRLQQLQPSTFRQANIHVKVDDSRARKSPTEGGLGYDPPWSTLEGMCQVVSDHLQDTDGERVRQSNAGGSSFDSGRKAG